MGEIFDINAVFSAIPRLLEVLPVSLQITAISMVVGLVFALLFAVIRMKKCLCSASLLLYLFHSSAVRRSLFSYI